MGILNLDDDVQYLILYHVSATSPASLRSFSRASKAARFLAAPFLYKSIRLSDDKRYQTYTGWLINQLYDLNSVITRNARSITLQTVSCDSFVLPLAFSSHLLKKGDSGNIKEEDGCIVIRKILGNLGVLQSFKWSGRKKIPKEVLKDLHSLWPNAKLNVETISRSHWGSQRPNPPGLDLELLSSAQLESVKDISDLGKITLSTNPTRSLTFEFSGYFTVKWERGGYAEVWANMKRETQKLVIEATENLAELIINQKADNPNAILPSISKHRNTLRKLCIHNSSQSPLFLQPRHINHICRNFSSLTTLEIDVPMDEVTTLLDPLHDELPDTFRTLAQCLSLFCLRLWVHMDTEENYFRGGYIPDREMGSVAPPELRSGKARLAVKAMHNCLLSIEPALVLKIVDLGFATQAYEDRGQVSPCCQIIRLKVANKISASREDDVETNNKPWCEDQSTEAIWSDIECKYQLTWYKIVGAWLYYDHGPILS